MASQTAPLSIRKTCQTTGVTVSRVRCLATNGRCPEVSCKTSRHTVDWRCSLQKAASSSSSSSSSKAAKARNTIPNVATVEVETEVTLEKREDIRNIAIIAHVDHGKTSMVDSMLKQSKVFRSNQVVEERIMDSNDLEKERGITILSKNTSLNYKGTKINIIDTPGHADFGGEVERVLNMVEGVLLLVDSVEGPMPQTRFVLKKALELGLTVVVVVNKIDRESARPDYVIDKTFELFCELGATDEQCDFPIVYASGLNGISGSEPDNLSDTLEPLFDSILSEIPPPRVNMIAPLQMLVTNIDYDDFKGRVAIGRIRSGSISKGETIRIRTPEVDGRTARVSALFAFENFEKKEVDSVEAGDIAAVCGVEDIQIGETIIDPNNGVPLPKIEVEEPTVRMTFSINTSPFSGKEGKYVTSRNIRDRLMKELEKNIAMRVEDGATSDTFIVSGRGTLHITILIENMRREGYEFCVGPPEVIMKVEDGNTLEPYEEAVVEVPEDHVGSAVALLNSRKGTMLEMNPSETGSTTTIKYKIPTRGLIGLRGNMLTATKGTAIINTVFSEYGPVIGDLSVREQGSLISMAQGQSTSYALQSLQDRGILFISPGQDVYEGMVVGQHSRPGDLKLNPCKAKAATNVRSNKDQTVSLAAPRTMTLDDAVEYIAPDEQVECTPLNIRLRKAPQQAGGKKR